MSAYDLMGKQDLRGTGRSGGNAFPTPAWQRFLKTGACRACRVPWVCGVRVLGWMSSNTVESSVKVDGRFGADDRKGVSAVHGYQRSG